MEPPSGRMGASLSASEDGRRLWLFGGNAGSGSLNDLYCLELETRTWSQVRPLTASVLCVLPIITLMQDVTTWHVVVTGILHCCDDSNCKIREASMAHE